MHSAAQNFANLSKQPCALWRNSVSVTGELHISFQL